MDENKKLEKPSKAYFYKVRDDDISGRGFKQLIGYVGFIFPIALYLIAGLRPINDQPSWRPLSSLSAYYYTSSTFVFGGVLFVLAAFFFIYRGYDNEKNYLDRRAAIIVWICALLVAFFPTSAPQGFIEPTWWAQWMLWVHNISAIILFGSLAYFSLGLFTESDDKKEMDEEN